MSEPCGIPDCPGYHAAKTYAPADRPSVEVEVDGVWYPGELRQWNRGHDGAWFADCSWSEAVGTTRLDMFPAERVRLVGEWRPVNITDMIAAIRARSGLAERESLITRND